MSNKILLADDDNNQLNSLKVLLMANNYDVTLAHDGDEAIEATEEDKFSCIVLNQFLKGTTGLDAIKQMRKRGVSTPIIVLTDKSEVDNKVECLDAGANSSITKPADKKELLAKIRSFIKTQNDRNKKYAIGNILFDKETSVLTNNNATYKLTRQESQIVEMLVTNKDRAITAEELTNKIWPEEENIDKSVIPMYISYLKNKFTALDANMIINHNNGYILEIKKGPLNW